MNSPGAAARHGRQASGLPRQGTARGIVQPAVKCRGREYLRIIYGPEYTAPEKLGRLRSGGLGAKRSLALREFALGIEALERFVRQEPLRRVHECVFGVLALESEPVDPRLGGAEVKCIRYKPCRNTRGSSDQWKPRLA